MIEAFIIWFALVVGCELYSYQVTGSSIAQAIMDGNFYFDKYDYLAIFILYFFPLVYFYIIMEDGRGKLDEY